MYTKTATAVVLALLGGANAADLLVAPSDAATLTASGTTKNFGCTGNKSLVNSGIEDEYECFRIARQRSGRNASVKVCASFTPEIGTPNTEGYKSSKCYTHKGWGLTCQKSTDGTTAVYFLGGEYRDDAEMREPECYQAVARYCRCGEGKWKIAQEQKMRDGVAVTTSSGAPVMQNKKERDAAGDVVKDVNGSDKYVYEWGDCPTTIKHWETNFEQLGKTAADKTAWMSSCPSNWEIPADGPPADPGSFKGYTNKYAFSNVNDDKFNDEGVIVTFSNESPTKNIMDDTAKLGCILGFGVFGIAIILVVTAIALDMKKRKQMYEELIADDLNTMDRMGLGPRMKEIQGELAARLAGGAAEGGVDDQLVTQALELAPQDFAQHM